MDFNNKHIVLIILIIIIFVFVYNYDVYVIGKGESLCKPIYVVKRELSPEIINELSESEKVVINEAFTTDYFGNIDMNSDENNNYKLPPKSLLSFNIPDIKDPNKTAVMESVIKVLSYIPTNISESDIKEMLEYFGLIYQTSDSLESFYKNVSNSTKIKTAPYNTKYSQLILFLIGKFNNDYTFFKSEYNSENIKFPSSVSTTQQYLNNSGLCNFEQQPIINNEANSERSSQTRSSKISKQNQQPIENRQEIIKNTKQTQNISFENDILDENSQEYSELEDDVISELESQIDKKTKSKNKVRFLNNSQENKYKYKKGKIKGTNYNKPTINTEYSNNKNQIFKRRKNKSNNNHPKNCNCIYKCDSNNTEQPRSLDTLESYNNTDFESFGSFSSF